jgi:hypothetical protein
MLTIYSGRKASNCEGISRRDFIRAGSLMAGGLTLPSLLRAKALGGQVGKSFVRDKSVVLLFLSGGASQIETFDPKMTAPQEIRSVTGEVPTSLPGVTFGGTFPELAKWAHQMAIVRSFAHAIGNHEQAIVHMLTGGTDPTGTGNQGFSMGSMYARLRGANHERTGLPTYGLLTSKESDGQYSKEKARIQKGSSPGSLGAQYGPFDPSGGGEAVENMRLNIPQERLHDRRALLAELDQFNRRVDSGGLLEGLDKFDQQALEVIVGGAGAAFDVSREDPALVERYDTSKIKIGHKVFRPSDLGRQMLLARRLCEAGCGFVTVHSAGWDMHADGNNPGVLTGMNMLGRTVDKAVTAFLEDVQQRGLFNSILLVICGDFGRTPKVNARGGRDHWARLCPLAFAGGGLNMGQVIGQSERNADVPASDPYSIGHLMATIMHALFDVPTLRLESGVPKDILRLVENGEPIRQLF